MTDPFRSLVNELDASLVTRHRADRKLFEYLTESQISLGLLHGDRPICPFLRPFFLAESKYLAVCRAAALLSRSFAAITAAALVDDELLSMLGITESEAYWARLDPGYTDVCVTSRLDTFLSDDGFWFIEYNAENPAGIGDQASLESHFKQIPGVRRFLDENQHFYPQPQSRLLDALDGAYRDFGGTKQRPNIGIVDWEGVATGSEFFILREFFVSNGYQSRICDPGELSYRSGTLMAGDFEIDIFYKRVLIHEFLDRFDDGHPLYQACADGAVCMANSFRSKIAHKKSGFAVLTDERYRSLFSDAELQVIDAHVPWTRKFNYCQTNHKGRSVDLVEYIRQNRATFILKPNDDYGGKGIICGWDCSQQEFDDAIGRALSLDYVVQERVASDKSSIPVFRDGEAMMESLNVDFDPFLFLGEVEGAMVRLAPGSLVNISQGGEETALVIVRGF